MAVGIKLNKCNTLFSLFGHKRFLSTCQSVVHYEESRLVGRDFIDPNDYTSNEFKDLLWTAFDLKCTMRARKNLNLDLLSGKSVTVLMHRHCIKTQLAVPNAATMLGAMCNVCVDKDWEQSACIPDLGRFLATQSDIIFCLSNSQDAMSNLANGSDVPVVGMLSNKYACVKGMTDLMTVFEHFGRLKGLTMGYTGPPEPLFNTYLTMLPRLKMDLKFATNCSPTEPKSPILLDLGLKYCQQNNTGMRECLSLSDALYRADIIATVKHNIESLRITMKEAQEAAVDWILLHSLPRTEMEVTHDVFYNKRCMAWNSASNTTYMAMAIMLRLLQDFEPKIKRPDFEGDANSCL